MEMEIIVTGQFPKYKDGKVMGYEWKKVNGGFKNEEDAERYARSAKRDNPELDFRVETIGSFGFP